MSETHSTNQHRDLKKPDTTGSPETSMETKENYELSDEEKRELNIFWSILVLGEEQPFSENIATLDNEQLITRFYSGLEKSTAKLLTDQPKGWALIEPATLVEKLRGSADFAWQYCQQINNCFAKVKGQTTFDISSKWDQTPADMKRSGQFCCVGSSLIGSFYLEKAGLEHYVGMPHRGIQIGDYQVAGYAAGPQTVLVPYEYTKNLLNDSFLTKNN